MSYAGMAAALEPCPDCGSMNHKSCYSGKNKGGAVNEVDFGVEPYSPEDAVMGACGILDVIRSEWGESWSEHDQKVRAGLSRILSGQLLSDYQGYCLKIAHPETPNIVCLCRKCKRSGPLTDPETKTAQSR